MNLHRSGLAWLGLLALAGCGSPSGHESAAAPPAEAPAAGRALVLGDVEPDDPTRVADGLRPLASYLGARLAEHGIGRGLVRIAPDPETMGRWMSEGEVDVYFDTPYPSWVVRETAAARPLLRRWRDGAPEYHGVLFARADSGLRELSDLAGRVVAFDDPASTSGYILPAALLLEAGLRPAAVGSAEQVLEAPGTAYVFTGDDTNVIEWVLSGRAAAGAIDNLSWSVSIPPETRELLRILGQTEPQPRGLVMLRAGVGAELEAAIRALLLALHETEDGRAILASMLTTRFDEFETDPQGVLDRIGELSHAVSGGAA